MVSPVQTPDPAGGRSLSGLGRLAFILFLVAGLAGGIAIRNRRARRIAAAAGGRGGGGEAERRRGHDRRPDDRPAERDAAHAQADRQARHHVHPLLRHRPALLPVARDLLQRPVRAQHRRRSPTAAPNALAAFDEHRTLGVWLQAAGYRTAFVGKYLNGYGLGNDPEHVPPGWSEWHALLEPTTQSYFDYDINDNGTVRRYGAAPDDYKTPRDRPPRRRRDPPRRARATGRSSCTSASTPRTRPAPRRRATPAASPGARRRAPPPSTRPTCPTSRASCATARRSTRPPLDRIDSRNERALESLKEVDRQVARIVEALRAQGELGNTYLVLHLRQRLPRRRAPRRVRQAPAIRPVQPRAAARPRAAAWPPPPTPRRSSATSTSRRPSSTSPAPRPTATSTGARCRACRAAPKAAGHRPLVIESLVRDRSTYYGYPYRAIRTGRWLYVAYSTGDRELYDLRRRPAAAREPRRRTRLHRHRRLPREGARPPARLQGRRRAARASARSRRRRHSGAMK